MLTLEEINDKVAMAWIAVNSDPVYKVPAYAKKISYSSTEVFVQFDSTNLPELDAISSGQHFTYKPIHILTDQLTVGLSSQDGDRVFGIAHSNIDNRFTICAEQPDMVAYVTGSGKNPVPVHTPTKPVLTWEQNRIYAPKKHLHTLLTLVLVKLEYKDVCLIDPSRRISPISVYSIVIDQGKRYLTSVVGDVQIREYDVNSSMRTIHITKLRDFSVKLM